MILTLQQTQLINSNSLMRDQTIRNGRDHWYDCLKYCRIISAPALSPGCQSLLVFLSFFDPFLRMMVRFSRTVPFPQERCASQKT